MTEQRTSHHIFLATIGLLFLASSVATVVWCRSMDAMGRMPMPGGWTMSMTWMRMPGQSWPGAAASFVAMWAVMMTAMMLPSLVPVLWRFRVTGHKNTKISAGFLTTVAGIGYLLIWTMWGVAIFLLGVVLAEMEMNLPALARSIPAAVAVVVSIAGVLQFSEWKLRYLACCRSATEFTSPSDIGSALRYGLRFGMHCSCSCANLTAILLALGVMDIRAMALVTTAITAERLAPEGAFAARTIGIGVIGMSLYLGARAIGLA